MKFVFVATQEYKASPISLKLAYWLLAMQAAFITAEVFLSGGLVAIAPQLSIGSGIVGALIAFLVFDIANTLVRKRKTARFLAMVVSLGTVIISVLASLQNSTPALSALAAPGILVLFLVNSRSANRYFSPKPE